MITYTVNGVSLEQPGKWRLHAGTRIWTGPAERPVTGVRRARRPGTVPVLDNQPGPTPLPLVLHIYGETEAELQRNLNTLNRLFGPSPQLLTVIRTYTGMVEPWAASAEVITPLEPEVFATCRTVEAQVTLSLVEGSWKGAIRSTTVAAGTGVSLQGWAGPAWDDWSAPVFDPVFVVSPTGATTDIRVTDDASRTWWSLKGDAGAAPITVDPSKHTAVTAGGAIYSGLYDQTPSDFRLTPGGTITISGSSTVTIQGAVRYL